MLSIIIAVNVIRSKGILFHFYPSFTSLLDIFITFAIYGIVVSQIIKFVHFTVLLHDQSDSELFDLFKHLHKSLWILSTFKYTVVVLSVSTVSDIFIYYLKKLAGH